jgi:hypothetical protein
MKAPRNQWPGTATNITMFPIGRNATATAVVVTAVVNLAILVVAAISFAAAFI